MGFGKFNFCQIFVWALFPLLVYSRCWPLVAFYSCINDFFFHVHALFIMCTIGV